MSLSPRVPVVVAASAPWETPSPVNAHQVARRGLARTFQLVRPFLGLTTLDNVVAGVMFSPNGTASRSQSEARASLGIGGSGPLVLFAGRVQPLKGLNVAIDALPLTTGVCSPVCLGQRSGRSLIERHR